jgi:hypothetical protein
MVSISSDTLAAKVNKHAGPAHSHDIRKTMESLLASLPEMLAGGQQLGKMRADQVWIIIMIGGWPWRVVIKKSARGYMHIQTIHPVSPQRIRKWENDQQR